MDGEGGRRSLPIRRVYQPYYVAVTDLRSNGCIVSLTSQQYRSLAEGLLKKALDLAAYLIPSSPGFPHSSSGWSVSPYRATRLPKTPRTRLA
jgi:hypothetical protein